MNFCIREINNDDDEICAVKEFLYGQIKEVYDIGPTPEFHYDIEGINEYYIAPKRNNFYVAFYEDKLVATAAIRGYDKDYELFRGIYSEEDSKPIQGIPCSLNKDHALCNGAFHIWASFFRPLKPPDPVDVANADA